MRAPKGQALILQHSAMLMCVHKPT